MTTKLLNSLTENLSYYRNRQKDISTKLKIERLKKSILYLLERQERGEI